jgi:hypothetical protein
MQPFDLILINSLSAGTAISLAMQVVDCLGSLGTPVKLSIFILLTSSMCDKHA